MVIKKYLGAASIVVLLGMLVLISTANAHIGVDVGGETAVSSDGASGSANASAHAEDADEDEDEDMDDDEDETSEAAVLMLTQKEAASVSVDAESAELAADSVSSSADLSVFATAQLKRDVHFKKVEATSDHVTVVYQLPARFLGFVPASVSARATVTASGDVDIDYPWYRFLFAVPRSATAEAELEAKVETILTDVHADAGLTATIEAKLIEAMRTALAGGAAASVGTTADMGGTGDDAVLDASGNAAVEQTND